MNLSISPESEKRVPVATWLSVLENEYLSDYIRSGGAAVKVVSGASEPLRDVRCRLEEIAEANGCHYAYLNPAEPEESGKKPDLHRVEKLFFAATANVDWKGWATAQARRHLAERGIELLPHRQLSDLEGIAADNDRDTRDLLHQYQSELATPQLRDHGMAVEFRTAVTALSRAQLIPDAVSPTTEEVLLHWLAGKSLPGSSAALKRIQIYERISHANARYMLASFCSWLPRVGKNGLVVVLDFRPYEHKKISKTQRQAEENRQLKEAIALGASTEELASLVKKPDVEPAITYTDAAYMQMLAMIRRFIDEIDWFKRLLMVILTTPSYYDSASRRNYNDYDALQTRIGLEVRDANRANPAATLVHLEEDV